MQRLVRLTATFALIAVLTAACAGTPAPAAEAPAQAAEASGGAAEMPPPDPADQAQEATVEPATDPSATDQPATDQPATDQPATNAEAAAGVRTFQLVPEESRMQYFVEEEFLGQAVPFITAIGATRALEGEMALRFDEAGVAIERSEFTADLSTLTSDRPRRDQAIRDRWLESSRFPIATFAATEVMDLPADAALGQDVPFQVQGDMTIRDVTNPITWDMTARVDGGMMTGAATTFFYMKEYGFDPPDVAGILRVTDGVTVTVNFVAQETP